MKNDKPTFASLKEIAKVFNVPENRISGWGIIKRKKAPLSPCIIIKGSSAVIDVLNAVLLTPAPWLGRSVTKAVSQRTGDKISLCSAEGSVTIEKSTLYSIYSRRWFSDGETYL